MSHLKVILGFFLLALPAICLAGTPPPDGPSEAEIAKAEDTAREYFRSLQKDGIASSVEFMHPEALDRFRGMLQPLLQTASESEDSALKLIFGPNVSSKALREMSPKGFMRVFMEFVAAQVEDAGVSFADLEIVGSIPEGKTVHVLARLGVGGPISMKSMEIISLRQHEKTWMVLLTGEMEGLAQMLRQSMASAEDGLKAESSAEERGSP